MGPAQSKPLGEGRILDSGKAVESDQSQPLKDDANLDEGILDSGKAVESDQSQPFKDDANLDEGILDSGKAVEIDKSQPLKDDANLDEGILGSGKAVEIDKSQPFKDDTNSDIGNLPDGKDSDDNDSDEDFVGKDSDEESDDEYSDEEGSDEEGPDEEGPDEEDSDEEGSDKSMAEEDHDGDLNYIEVKQVGGKYIKFKAAKPTQDDDIQSKVKEDERFGANTRRGGARLAMVIVRAEANGKRVYDKEVDMSDEATEKASSYRWEMIPCKRGTYKAVKGKGETKYKQLTKSQMDNSNIDDDEPCTCVICVAREKNAVEALPVGSSRTRGGGKKDPFAKYGPGKMLGSN